MSSFTLSDQNHFPQGQSVAIYPVSNWPNGNVDQNAAPIGSATDTQTMGATNLTFTGLTDGTQYVAYALVNGAHRYTFVRPPASTDAQLVTETLDSDGTLAANSDQRVATQKAVRTALNGLPGGVVGSNRFGLAAGIYNVKASNTKKLRGAMGKAVAATAPGVIAIAGDSNSGGAVVDPAVNSYPSRLLDLLESTGVVIAGSGYVLPTNNTSQDSRMVFTGTAWTILSSSGKTPIALSPAASGSKVTFTSERTGTVVNVLYPGSGATYGPFTVTIDGGTPVTVTPSGVTGLHVYSVSGLADTTHVVEIASTTNTIVGIAGIEVTKTNGLTVHNFGIGGSRTFDWAATGVQNAAPVLAGLAPDLTIIMLQTNDAVNAIDLATYEANLNLIIDRFQATGDVVLMTEMPSGSVPDATWATYTQSCFTVADAQDIPLIHLGQRFGTATEAQANGLMWGDNLHATPAGYGMAAIAVKELLTI